VRAVILAGGAGTRLVEETTIRPKPMVEVGGHPILWHVMKTYAHHGITDFILCLGYKAQAIKAYFYNYFSCNSDTTIDTATGDVVVHKRPSEQWRVTLVDTGLTTQTGGRLARIAGYLDPQEPFCMTYADGVGDIDIQATIREHRKSGALVTVAAVRPAEPFGRMSIESGRVLRFDEKPEVTNGWVSGGYFVLSPEVLGYIDGDGTAWEREPMTRLTKSGQVSAYHHAGFWQCMDTQQQRTMLEELWRSGRAPWKVW